MLRKAKKKKEFNNNKIIFFKIYLDNLKYYNLYIF
jgi:hypothetical protein